jgi:hypothetical protein
MYKLLYCTSNKAFQPIVINGKNVEVATSANLLGLSGIFMSQIFAKRLCWQPKFALIIVVELLSTVWSLDVQSLLCTGLITCYIFHFFS